MTSWKPEVIADSSGKWTSNALRFATEEEALRYARRLAARWTLVSDYRAAPSPDPVADRLMSDGTTIRVTPCSACGGKGYVEARVFTQEPMALLDIPAATRIVCANCAGDGITPEGNPP